MWSIDMKRCPQCASSFPDTDQFCEIDGTLLIYAESDEISDPLIERDPQSREAHGVIEEVEFQRYRRTRGSEAWKIVAGLAVASVLIGAVLFILYQQMTGDADERGIDEASNISATQPPSRVLTAQPVAVSSASPTPETSPSPSVTPPAAGNAEAGRAVLSSSPVSTAVNEQLKGSTVVIRLTNGTNVEADEVWETGEGIWYRRSGLVTLLERNNVASIVRTPPPPSPTEAPTTSP